MMQIRKKIIPNNFGDICSLVFILSTIPLIYYFELFVVLPDLFDSSSPWFFAHFIWGTFTLVNIISNYVATLVIDTSVGGNITMDFETAPEICSICNIPAPARSWHCIKCDTCILKRDHHCTFVGYCVGHLNHRYFIWFLFFLFLGTLQGSYLNIFFVKGNYSYNPFLVVQLLFPLSFFFFGFDKSVNYCYLLIIMINLVGMLITGVLLWFHSKLILNGTTCHENARNNFSYNIGPRENIKRVLGERWYLTWISAFIESKLPENGRQWSPGFFDELRKTL